ncbi:hypothetical protein BHU72_14815 [Desulfuribacillus stibiiarsenatis]|uniref:Uncharacterized protein n=1 Tax=Desulfuribacillus stibiiarsenatis TaxID=1390249 RepID=A0A1E5L785_9FIRM|nr:hypothetical protein [Desulfuribacillus stibiiarsenatis]OEH86022.1 hypothetical protein BHU72_14815 [Desulfuribacillus stibiiarsenatis]
MEWIDDEKLLEELGPYHTYYLKRNVYINPQDIIALSRELSPSKYERLKKIVNKEGWQNVHVTDFHLGFLPNGKLIVLSGGNHRSALSKEMKIPKVLASVVVLVFEKDMNESERKAINLASEKYFYFYRKSIQYSKIRNKTNNIVLEKTADIFIKAYSLWMDKLHNNAQKQIRQVIDRIGYQFLDTLEHD